MSVLAARSSARRPTGPWRYRGRHARRGFGALTALLLAIAGLTGVVLTSVGSSANAAAGTVAGTVFEDYNANGTIDAGSNTAGSASATDVGVAGATVTVTDSTGATVGTATSAANGTFSISVTSAATNAVRVEVTPPTGYSAGAHGTDSHSTVQFVTLGSQAAGAVDVALSRQGDYSQPNPRILTVEQVAAINTTGSVIVPSSNPTLVSSAYGDRGTTATTTEATEAQTGTVWGDAAFGTNYAFTAASFKRHAPVGPGGLGAIYLTHVGTGTANATSWVTIPNAGTNPRTNESSYTFDQWFHDIAAYPLVGKIGLGGIAVAPDHSALYVVNLNNKQLYRVPITLNGSGAPVAGTAAAVTLPLSLPGHGAGFGCDSDNVRPYGVDTQSGALWVTLTCTGPSTSDLHGYVYRYDLTTQSFGTAPAFEMDLSGYTRGSAFLPGHQAPCTNVSDCLATWHVWPATDTTFPTFPAGSPTATASRPASYPEPLLSGVTFDSNGDMTIGVKDRFSDQIGYEAGDLTNGDNDTFEGISAGDTLRACGNPSSGWTLEHNGACGSRTGVAISGQNGAGDDQGPGGGEFYYDDVPGFHNQVTLGSLLQLPGYGQVVSSAYDPNPNGDVRTSGLRFLSNTNGGYSDSHQLIAQVNSNGTGAQGSFSKAGGLGDVAALVAGAPIEIGNRVWLDTNFNGKQDAGESSVAGVTVHLYTANGTTPLATAVTDSNGNYYFSSATGSNTLSSIYNLDTLTPGTPYKVKLDHAADYSTGGPLSGYTPTTTAAGSDTAIDSNGATVSDVDQASVTTGAAGVDDHTIDFGFVPPTYAVGDFVWKDTNKNGIQDSGEPGVAGVTVTLLTSDGTPAHHPNGTLVAPVQTNDAGHYSFDFLGAGDYRAVFSTVPTGYSLTTQSATGSTQANDSNPVITTGRTPIFAIGPVSSTANMRAVESGDDVSQAVAINPTIDAGLVVGPSVSVGDFVWNDTNHNGVQDSGEPGINGVTVTLTGPGGGPVTDIFGNTVGATETSGNGGYLFKNLPPLAAGESYTTHVDNDQSALSGYVPTLTGKGTRSTDSSTGHASSGDLTTGGASDLTLDYGFVKPVEVGDFVWVDTNGNGIQNKDEPGIPDVVLTITDKSGNSVTDLNGDTVGPQVTNSHGKYEFTNLPPGQYVVHVKNSQPALSDYSPTDAGKGHDRAKDSSTKKATSLSLSSGDSDQTLDFGFVSGNGDDSGNANNSGSDSGNADSGLAGTGVPAEELIWLALAGMVGGAGLTIASRRRRA